MIDLDELLFGNPTWDEVVEFWKNDDFCEERYLVEAIERWLQTEEQRKEIFDHHLSIEKILNGSFPCTKESVDFVNSILTTWNTKLGFRAFSF